MIDFIIWIIFLYPLVGLCIFWPITCLVDRELPPLSSTIQITFLWPIMLFLIVLFKWDQYERKI